MGQWPVVLHKYLSLSLSIFADVHLYISGCIIIGTLLFSNYHAYIILSKVDIKVSKVSSLKL